MKLIFFFVLILASCSLEPLILVPDTDPTGINISILAVGQSYLTRMGADTMVIDSSVATVGSNVKVDCPSTPYEGNINGLFFSGGWTAGLAREHGLEIGGNYPFGWASNTGKWGIGGVMTGAVRQMRARLNNKINVVTAARSGAAMDAVGWDDDFLCSPTANGHQRLSLLPAYDNRLLVFYHGAADMRDNASANAYKNKLLAFIDNTFDHGYQQIIMVQANPNVLDAGAPRHPFKLPVMDALLDLADGQYIFTIPEWLKSNGNDKAQPDDLHPSTFAMDSIGRAIGDLLADLVAKNIDVPQWKDTAYFDGNVCTWAIESASPAYATQGAEDLRTRFSAWNMNTEVAIDSVAISNNIVFIYPSSPITQIAYLYGWGHQNHYVYLRNQKQYGFLPYKRVAVQH